MAHSSPGSPGTRRPVGAGGWVALAVVLVAGAAYTVVLAITLALALGGVTGLMSRLGAAPDPHGSAADPFEEYPGITDGDSGQILAQPSSEDVQQAAEAAVAAVQTALGGSWSPSGDGYYEHSDNDYGGASMLYDYASPAQSRPATYAPGDKRIVVDRLEAALAPLGLDSIEIADDPASWNEAGYDIEGHDDVTGGESSPLWVVTAHSSTDFGPWLEIGIVQGADDDIREALGLWDITVPDPGVYVQAYAWGLLEAADRQSFIDGLDDFGGVAPLDDGPAAA